MKVNWPTPYNPNNAPETPGYRILSIGESLKDAEYWGNKTWRRSCYGHLHVKENGCLDMSYRKPLYLDDPYAPPPEEFTREGYEMVKDYINDGDQYQYWNHGCKRWVNCHVHEGFRYDIRTNTNLFYYRTKINKGLTDISNQLDESKIITLRSFSQDKDKNMNVDSNINMHISKYVVKIENEHQFNALIDIAVKHGKKSSLIWPTCHIQFPNDLAIDLQLAELRHASSEYYKEELGTTILNFGDGLNHFLSTLEPLMSAPIINNYSADYRKGEVIVKFGCASIDKDFFFNFPSALRHGNRRVKSITLDSGVTITKEEMLEVRKYIEYIDGIGKI